MCSFISGDYMKQRSFIFSLCTRRHTRHDDWLINLLNTTVRCCSLLNGKKSVSEDDYHNVSATKKQNYNVHQGEITVEYLPKASHIEEKGQYV